MFKRATSVDPLIKKSHRFTRLALAQLYWEGYAPVFALALAIVALFLIGSFGGVWERFGDPLRAAALIFALYFLIKAILKAPAVTRPKVSAARRRVETDAGLMHRPLDTLDDTPALSENLWPTHYAQARQAASNVERTKLRPALAPIDPYFMRYAIPAALGLSLMLGSGDNLERLRRSLALAWTSGINPNDVTFDAWVDPPDYTGRPPIYFKDKRKIAIPAGSELVARITGAKDAPRLKIIENRDSRYLRLERLGPESFEARAILTEDATARWRIGNRGQSWKLPVIPDERPVVNFDEPPKADKRDRLTLSYSFEDDYGVEELLLSMRLLSDDPTEADDSDEVNVPLASRSVRRAEKTVTALDLTKHRWAGRKVVGRLVAVDGLGQSAQTQDVYFTVPDKIFVEPLAKAIIEQRNLVMTGDANYAPVKPIPRREWGNQPWFDTYQPDKRLGRAPAKVQRAAVLMEAITDTPAGVYSDPAVYMGLINVLGRLRYGDEQADLSGIPEDLWSIALRAEFGLLGTALEEMREAEQALQDAMARRAPQREIDTLFERYNEAVDRYTEELRRKALEEGNFAEGGQGGGGDQQSLDEIQKLEEANRQGDTEGARKALKQLAELLENMKIQLAKGGGGEGMPSEGEMSEEMKESLEELADLLGEQRELKDETEQAENQQGEQQGGEAGGQQEGQGENKDPQGGQGQGALSPGQLAQQQSALEKALEGLEGALPNEAGGTGGSGEEEGENGGGGDNEDPEGQGAGSGDDPREALGEAGEAMAESRRALEQGDLAGAGEAQDQAIQALRRAGQSLAETAGRGRRGQNQSAQADGETDPLGRENGGTNDDNSEADIDQRDNATRSRELMLELRRRAAEQEREQSEREYLERLLRRF